MNQERINIFIENTYLWEAIEIYCSIDQQELVKEYVADKVAEEEEC
jgi:hypothetical protein